MERQGGSDRGDRPVGPADRWNGRPQKFGKSRMSRLAARAGTRYVRL